MIKVGTLCLLTIFSLNLYAFEIKGQQGVLEVQEIEGFKFHTDFLGLPFVFIESAADGNKASVSITPTGVEDVSLEAKLLQENYDQYKVGRKQWANKRDFSDLEFLPFESFSNRDDVKVIAAGYSYAKSNGQKNIEKSYYVLCPKELFQIKLLSSYDKGRGLIEKVDGILSSSRCL